MNEPENQSLAVLESSKIKLTQVAVSREVRSFQRRLLTAFGNETDSDLLKFNQLKVIISYILFLFYYSINSLYINFQFKLYYNVK